MIPECEPQSWQYITDLSEFFFFFFLFTNSFYNLIVILIQLKMRSPCFALFVGTVLCRLGCWSELYQAIRRPGVGNVHLWYFGVQPFNFKHTEMARKICISIMIQYVIRASYPPVLARKLEMWRSGHTRTC